jgi:serine/threonine protein kinase
MIGKSLGSYQIVEELGRGGMAIVYRAYQPSLNRYVAVKVLPPQLSFDQQFVDRFQREARAAANLRHPNIVVIHDVGHHDDTYYIVMEYLEGRTLKDLVEQTGPLPPQRATRIVEQIAAALDYAHQRGFIHRDVKPANIFVGEGDRVTLTDFGIAKAASETEHLTRTGTLMGTPEYMSPEQAGGGTVDHRTDLYALGVVLYQMLVGRVPFRGTTPHAVLHHVIYEAPLPPRQLNPDLSPALEPVVLKAIAKQPDHRYQRGSALVKDLRQALAEPRTRAMVAAPPRVEKPSGQRHSPAVWILGGIAAFVVLIIGGLLVLIATGDNGNATPSATVAMALATPTEVASEQEATPTREEPAIPVPTIPTAASATPTMMEPSETPETPTETPQIPTDTPSPLPTPTCAVTVDPLLISAWDHELLGCPTSPSHITWAAWEPFEQGAMLWRQDTDRIYIFQAPSSGASASRGDWQETPQEWKWDGSNPDGIGLSPPAGLYEPVRGFGWLWRTHLGGSNSFLGWAREEEKGFCTSVQPFQRGILLHSNTVEYCEDELYNWATHPSFRPLFFALYRDGTWQRY